MFVTIISLVLPALVIFTTLFGVLARGNPKPGGVALFARVGIVGLLLGGIAWYLVDQMGLLGDRPAPVVNGYRGLIIGSIVLVGFAIFGQFLKRRP